MKLDKKDYDILRVLDENFRFPLSKIAKKVSLSKNSVGLRFKKLKSIMLHNTAGINNKLLGYTLVKIFYVIDSFDKKIEELIITELEKQKHVVYAAKLYGHYNLEVAMFTEDFDDLSGQIDIFNRKFSKFINEKEVEIIVEEFFFRNKFLFDVCPEKIYKVIASNKKTALSNSDKKILLLLRIDPRISILEIAERTSLNPKTVMHCIREMELLGIIMGYFMMLDYSVFNLSTYKMLIQVNNFVEKEKFEEYLSKMKNIKHFSRMLGFWDYEADVLFSSSLELNQEIEKIRQVFPRQIKKIEIINHGKRIVTNKEKFLIL